MTKDDIKVGQVVFGVIPIGVRPPPIGYNSEGFYEDLLFEPFIVNGCEQGIFEKYILKKFNNEREEKI